jgi:hypothetical protein
MNPFTTLNLCPLVIPLKIKGDRLALRLHGYETFLPGRVNARDNVWPGDRDN